MNKVETRSLTSYWINVGSGSEKDAREIATSINAEAFTENTYGFAKAICLSNSSPYSPKWNVQILTTECDTNQKKLYSKRITRSKQISYKSELGITPLLYSIKNVLDSIRKKRMLIVNPEQSIRKMNKLIIYLYATSKWPFKNEIDSIKLVFDDFYKRIDTNELSITNQTVFSTFIKCVNKELHRQSMGLRQITLKIITKAEGEAAQGTALFEQIKELIRIGTENILTKNPAPDHVVFFNQVFALHAYVYMPNADYHQGQLELKQNIKRLVELLIDYDRKNNSSTLLDFTMRLMNLMINHFTNVSPDDHLRMKSIASLVWMFKDLVNNKNFIDHMQASGKQNETIPNKAYALLSQEKTWSAVADFIVFLGNRKFFNEVVGNKILPTCTLDKEQINLLFLNLNKKLREVGLNEEFKGMYLDFLKMLTNANKLHFLKTYASHRDNIQDLRRNLIDLDFSFMEGEIIPLESFFSNPTYKVLCDQNVVWNPAVGRTLVKLFARFGENPVENKMEFINFVNEVVDDMYTGFDHLCEQLLSKIGESGGVKTDQQGNLISVEKWLFHDVLPIYQTLKYYVLRCLPLQWKTEAIAGPENLLNRLCLEENRLYKVACLNNKDFSLTPLFPGKKLPVPKTILVSEHIEQIKGDLKSYVRSHQGSDALAYLTESYLSYYSDNQIKKEVEFLLDIIFINMKESDNSVSFAQRTQTVAEFLRSISPLFKRLNSLVEKRFFDDWRLKLDLIDNLIVQTDILMNQSTTQNTQIGHGIILEHFSKLDFRENLLLVRLDEENQIPVQDVAVALALFCIKDLRDIIVKCSLVQLTTITSQFEYLIGRKIDELSYSKKQFIDSFCNYAINKNHFPDNSNLVNAIGSLEMKEEIMTNYGDYLKNQPIPINFILPNQALAMTVCTCTQFQNNNILLKMGTGQGKSLVIALAALKEAQRIRDNPHGKVFVFTSYDHLAQRDHQLAKYFFEKDKIKSICISKIENVSEMETDTKIIYADIENIDTIIRSIMIKLLQNKALPKEIAFIKIIYENEDISIVLDEYDLLLFDLEAKQPFVEYIPKTFLDVYDVRNNREYWASLADATYRNNDVSINTKTADQSSGKEFNRVSYFDSRNASFNLPVSIMRLTKLIQRATRVIGLSGTAPQNERHNLNNLLYFELPSSQNPEAFETKIYEDIVPISKDEICISCHQRTEFTVLRKENDVFIIEESEIKKYCDAILEDIRNRQNDSTKYKRPVLVFADPYYKYKTPNNNVIHFLWTTLERVIRQFYPALNICKDNVSDAELQAIARIGAITMSSIKYGRGADIRVNLDVEEGLHVTIATPVINKRLRNQLIGRTGRMGRKGSYSAITIGSLITPSVLLQASKSDYYDALHDLTKFFINKVTNSPYDIVLCKNWMLFLGSSYSNSACKIKRSFGEEFCGESINSIPGKFLL